MLFLTHCYASQLAQIPSRTVVQIRTHAQKYFQRLNKRGIVDPDLPYIPPKAPRTPTKRSRTPRTPKNSSKGTKSGTSAAPAAPPGSSPRGSGPKLRSATPAPPAPAVVVSAAGSGRPTRRAAAAFTSRVSDRAAMRAAALHAVEPRRRPGGSSPSPEEAAAVAPTAGGVDAANAADPGARHHTSGMGKTAPARRRDFVPAAPGDVGVPPFLTTVRLSGIAHAATYRWDPRDSREPPPPTADLDTLPLVREGALPIEELLARASATARLDSGPLSVALDVMYAEDRLVAAVHNGVPVPGEVSTTPVYSHDTVHDWSSDTGSDAPSRDEVDRESELAEDVLSDIYLTGEHGSRRKRVRIAESSVEAQDTAGAQLPSLLVAAEAARARAAFTSAHNSSYSTDSASNSSVLDDDDFLNALLAP